MPDSRGFHTPGEIGLSYDYASMRGQDAPNPEMWVAHWPGASSQFQGDLGESYSRLKGYENYHLSKNWRGIAYDYAIDMQGHRFVLRGTGQSAATSGDFDEDGVPNNRESDAILCLIGPNQHPTVAMLDAFAWFLDWNPRKHVIGHREAKGTSTTCPGPEVMKHLVQPAREGQLIGGRKVTSKRIGGADRHETAAMLAYTAHPVSENRGGTVFLLASGSADTEGAANLHSAPILTVTKNTLPPATAEALRKYKPDTVVAIGGENTISDKVLAEANRAAR